mgnify:CR=1 FL=1
MIAFGQPPQHLESRRGIAPGDAQFVADGDFPELPHAEKLRFFQDTAKSFGRSALMLSGGATLGLFHVAVDLAGGEAVPPQRFGELKRRVAGISTNVLCECPKHVAELIAQLASFEAYSQECLNKNTEDAHLHSYLRAISGSARSLFENALEKIAQHEGIDLREAQH